MEKLVYPEYEVLDSNWIKVKPLMDEISSLKTESCDTLHTLFLIKAANAFI